MALFSWLLFTFVYWFTKWIYTCFFSIETYTSNKRFTFRQIRIYLSTDGLLYVFNVSPYNNREIPYNGFLYIFLPVYIIIREYVMCIEFSDKRYLIVNKKLRQRRVMFYIQGYFTPLFSKNIFSLKEIFVDCKIKRFWNNGFSLG